MLFELIFLYQRSQYQKRKNISHFFGFLRDLSPSFIFFSTFFVLPYYKFSLIQHQKSKSRRDGEKKKNNKRKKDRKKKREKKKSTCFVSYYWKVQYELRHALQVLLLVVDKKYNKIFVPYL